jgi:hypothetical protein
MRVGGSLPTRVYPHLLNTPRGQWTAVSLEPFGEFLVSNAGIEAKGSGRENCRL